MPSRNKQKSKVVYLLFFMHVPNTLTTAPTAAQMLITKLNQQSLSSSKQMWCTNRCHQCIRSKEGRSRPRQHLLQII